MRERGEAVFSPIAHSHPIALHGHEGDWETWAEFDRAVLGICTSLTVLMLDGWEQSRGIAAERIIAQDLALPIRYEAWPIAAGRLL